MPNRSGNVIISAEVTVTLEDGKFFNTTFQSKLFMERIIFTEPLLAGTRETTFEEYEVEDRLFSALDRVTNLINNNGKFRLIGWVKRGEVQDHVVDQSSRGLPSNVGKVMVQSGTVNHHITRLDPMTLDTLDITLLENAKFNVQNDFDK